MEKPKLRKAVYIKLEVLAPATQGHNIKVRVLELKKVVDKVKVDGKKLVIFEVLVGDETGTILLTARDEQAESLEIGGDLILRNAKVEMFKGFMRLVVDRWGKIEKVDKPHEFETSVDTGVRFSNVEYELVPVDG